MKPNQARSNFPRGVGTCYKRALFTETIVTFHLIFFLPSCLDLSYTIV